MVDLIDITITYDFVFESLIEELDESLLDEMVDMFLFKNALMRLRKGYHAISGAGSQNLYFHKVVNNFIMDYIDKQIYEEKQYLADNEEFDEKNFLVESVFWQDYGK